MARKLLLWCGIISSLLYISMNVFVPMQWHGYSSLSQTVSELSAIGAPTRAVWVALGVVWALLLIAFGYGVSQVAGPSRALRVAGGVLVAHGLFAAAWPPMHLRPVLAAGGATLTDTLHIAWTIGTGGFMALEMAFGAAAFGKRFRIYSAATLALVLACGALAGTDAARVQADLPTPWIGLWERLNIAAFMSWIIVFAVALLRRGSTMPFRSAAGEVVPGSVAEIRHERLGGLTQWVMIRGENISNPPLILLHGGPGMPENGFFRYSNAALERIFTVVYWDQRGAGKSFDARIPRASMTVEHFIADLDDLVDVVRARLGHSKVAILGHSWGSALGALYASRFPEKVSVYVGAAQVGDSQAAESASYSFAMAEAKRRDDPTALNALRVIGPPPYDAKAVLTERTWVQRLTGQLTLSALWVSVRSLLALPEFSMLDLPDVLRGFRFTLDAMWDEVSRLNLVKLVPKLRMPVFFFVGRLDHWIPPETSTAYFDALDAPSKKLIWFEHSGHEMFMDEPTAFNTAMAELVRPVLATPLAA